MALEPFRFRQFEIAHEKSAHKVGTDGILLGAWADFQNPKTLLDVGSGSGLIALMLAQRFPEAQIFGIEKEQDSFKQSLENVTNSPFSERVQIFEGDFLGFDFPLKFDGVVSNPPFYKNALSSKNEKRDGARHETSLPQFSLLEKALQLLNEDGKIALILPKTEGENLIRESEGLSIFLSRNTEIKPFENQLTNRLLLEFSKKPAPLILGSLFLKNENNERSKSYREMTQEFYL